MKTVSDRRTSLKIPVEHSRKLETYTEVSSLTVNKLAAIAIETFIELIEADTLEVPARVMMLRGALKKGYFRKP